MTVTTGDDNPATQRGSTRELLSRGLQAVAAGDWVALRSMMHEDAVWDIPGRSPLAGRLVGPDAVIERFRLMRGATAGDRPAELLAVLEGGDYAAAIQRNHIVGQDGREAPFTAITLITARDGRVAALQYFVSDQYMVDALWSRMLSET